MKIKSILSAGAVAAALGVAPSTVRADWIGDFYNSAGAGVNVTAPQAIASQSAIGFSGGGMNWRIPNKNFQPISITPPSLKAGCGGIDAYLGSYSFVNKDQFVQALRNFGQAAVGYFFELALRTMAPEIAVTLDVINDLANRVNQFSKGGCATAKFAVDKYLGPLIPNRTEEAAGYAASIGSAVDNFAAKFDIETDYAKIMENKYKQNAGKSKSALTDADAGKFKPVDVNALWWALNNANAADLTYEEMRLIMSMVGPTVINRSATSDDATENLQPETLMPTVSFIQLVGLDPNATGASLTVYGCDTKAECLFPTKSDVTVKPFNVRAKEAVSAIRTNISGRIAGGTFSAADQSVLKLTTVPLYRVASMAESAGVAAGVALGMIDELVEYAAVDAGVQFVNYYLKIADDSLAGMEQKLPENADGLKEMRDRIARYRSQMHTDVARYYKTKGNPYVKIDQLDKAERMMYANLNTMLAANARFAKRQ